MNAQKLLNEILPILYTVKENPVKLQKILQFLKNEIYEDPEEDPEEEEDDDIQVPEKYLKAVSEITDGIEIGNICFLNMDTLETEDVPENLLVDPEEFEAMTGESFKTMDYKYPTWENCMTFEPLRSNESFQIMQKFTNQFNDQSLQNKLEFALRNRKPFANFKSIIDNSEYRQQWFDFKKQFLENHVKELLSIKLSESEKDLELKQIN